MSSEGTYRLLLGLYPKDFRDEFGDDMVQLFRDMRRHKGRSWLAIWARAIPDLLMSAINERKEWVMSKKSGWALTAGALGAAAAYTVILVGVGGDIPRALLVFAVVSAVVVGLIGLSALIGRKMRAPAESAAPKRYNWWVPAPALIALGYMVMGVRPVSTNATSGDLISTAASVLFAGFIIFGVLFRYRSERNLGNWLIVVASLPAFGVVWFPVIPAIALITIVGSLSEVFSRRRRLSPAA